MAINSLEFATKFSKSLDKMVVQKSVTGFLADNDFGAEFISADTVMIPDMDLTGLADYKRDPAGYPTNGSISVERSPYKLTMDRAQKFVLDVMDADETGVANLAGQVLGEFARTKVVPELDMYNLSKIYQVSAENDGVVTVSGEKDYYDALIEAINAAWAAAGFDTELVAWINPNVNAHFMTTDKISRHIVISDFKQGDINLKVKSLNGVSLIPVGFDRMKSAFDRTDNGLAPTAEAKEIPFIVMPKKAASFIEKHKAPKIITPEVNQNADGYIFAYRIFYDLLVKKSNAKFIKSAIMG